MKEKPSELEKGAAYITPRYIIYAPRYQTLHKKKKVV